MRRRRNVLSLFRDKCRYPASDTGKAASIASELRQPWRRQVGLAPCETLDAEDAPGSPCTSRRLSVQAAVAISKPAEGSARARLLPCWKNLMRSSDKDVQRPWWRISKRKTAARRKKTGVKPPGPAAILTQEPHRQPVRSKKSPAPAFHAASQTVRRDLRDLYALFVAAYREAAEKLRAGNRNAGFPVGSFPPALPFVGG